MCSSVRGAQRVRHHDRVSRLAGVMLVMPRYAWKQTELSYSVLVDDVLLRAALICFIKERRCNPATWFSALQSSINRLTIYGSRTSQPPMLTPRIFSLPQLKSTFRFSLLLVSTSICNSGYYTSEKKLQLYDVDARGDRR